MTREPYVWPNWMLALWVFAAGAHITLSIVNEEPAAGPVMHYVSAASFLVLIWIELSGRKRRDAKLRVMADGEAGEEAPGHG